MTMSYAVKAALALCAGLALGGCQEEMNKLVAQVGALPGRAGSVSLDQAERVSYARALQASAQAARSTRVEWASVDAQGHTTASGWFVPLDDVGAVAGRDCRNVRVGIQRAGRVEDRQARICRSGAGWEEV